MLFRRRAQEAPWQRCRAWLWPRVSWRRSMLYFAKRAMRLPGTPYAIAMGCAAGTFVSFTPFLGVHIVLAIGLAWILRANLVAGALGTFVGNPLSFPLIWAGTYEVGQLVRSGEGTSAPTPLAEASSMSFQEILPMLEPMMIGAIPLGIAAGCIMYFTVYRLVLAYRAARRTRLLGKRNSGTIGNADTLPQDLKSAGGYSAWERR